MTAGLGLLFLSCGLVAATPEVELFDPLLADGFDFPVGDRDGKGVYTAPDGRTHHGFYRATRLGDAYPFGVHTGEDWNGRGDGDSDVGQPVFAVARGVVRFAGACPSPWGNVILVEHRFLENGAPTVVFSQYAHLRELAVATGAVIERRQQIGTIGKGAQDAYSAHLHLEIRQQRARDLAADYWPSSHGKDRAWVLAHNEDPTAFIASHRALLEPKKQARLLIVDKVQKKARLFRFGIEDRAVEVGLSQREGKKERQGDLRVPEGVYRVVEMLRGPFDALQNWVQAYLGTRFIRLNYPNAADARRGLLAGLVSKAEHDAIVVADQRGRIPPKNTRLGGGIGLHGWVEADWEDDSDRRLTWGCITFHRSDLESLYDELTVGDVVILR